MKVATLIPLTRQHGLPEISYFTDQDLIIGGVYDIPIRKSKVPAILTTLEPAINQKDNLKAKDFNLKPLPQLQVKYQIPKNFVQSANQIASYYAGSASTILSLWLGAIDHFLPYIEDDFSDHQTKDFNYIQIPYDQISMTIDRIYRERKQPITIITSDRNQSSVIAGILSNFSPTVLTSRSQPKTISEAMNSRSIIIAPRSFGPLMTLTSRTVILCNPGGNAWRERRRPYFQWDDAIKYCASNAGKKLYVISPVLDAESWQHVSHAKQKIKSFLPDTYDDNRNKKATIINRGTGQKQELDIIFERSVQELLKKNEAENTKTIIYVTRKGLYPVLICQDCGETTYTKKFREQIQRYQIASNVSDWVDPQIAEEWVDRCQSCGSWRLHPIAISLNQVEAALKQMFTSYDSKVAVVDTVSQKVTESRRAVKDFNDGKTFLLTTQRGLYLQNEQVPDVIVVSLDAALSSSSLVVETEMYRLLEYGLHLATRNLIVQTRLEKSDVINNFKKGSIRNFQNDSLKERKILELPPFYVQIKVYLSVSAILPHQKQLRQLVVNELDGKISYLPGIGEYKVAIITLPTESWQSSDANALKNYLYNLSLDYKLRINPDILL